MPSRAPSNPLAGTVALAASFLLRPAHPATPSAPASLGKLLSLGPSPGPLLAVPALPASTQPAAGVLRACCSIGVPYNFHRICLFPTPAASPFGTPHSSPHMDPAAAEKLHRGCGADSASSRPFRPPPPPRHRLPGRTDFSSPGAPAIQPGTLQSSVSPRLFSPSRLPCESLTQPPPRR
jgi:hypothetical protein